MPELLVILAVALIVIGPKKLPDLARSLGKALGEFKRATNDLKQSIEQEAGMSEVRDTIRKAGQDARRTFNEADTAEKNSGEAAEAQSATTVTETPFNTVAAAGEPSKPVDPMANHTAALNRVDDHTVPKENGRS
ncbi:MAG: Sec-independent protein translocase protein TatB [Desulfobacteraceae bacterium]|nr:Sec-independent protein translocase protein TatB [Desulfobacteraceae bacterium]